VGADQGMGSGWLRSERALVAQRIEHLTTDQKVGGSNPSERADKVQVRRSNEVL